MKEIKTGDRVKFLNETGSGVVTELLDKEMVLVRTDDDGFEYPVLRSELLISQANTEDMDIEDLAKLDVIDEVAEPEPHFEDEQIPEGEEQYPEESLSPEKISQSSKDENAIKADKPKKEVRKPTIEEVDLHISQIIDDSSDMSSGEIVEIQLARFRTALVGAINAKQNKIVFIHGKGEGKLKREIQKIIDSEYKMCRYQDASFREYGYGATMIFIR